MLIFRIILFFFFWGTPVIAQNIDPYKFIATLKFDDSYLDYFFRKSEQMFPVSFSFNTNQVGNENNNIENACEKIVKYAIGDSIYGTGRTGVFLREPNDQSPSLYFHLAKCDKYEVYEYWLYYADNDYLNDHEHDWEKYFVYVKNNIPLFVGMSSHKKIYFYTWAELPKDDGHIILGVNGGSHAMQNKIQNGVEIRYNGNIHKKSGTLLTGDGKTFPWRIYTNDANVIAAVNYIQKPDCFFGGDPFYYAIPWLSSKNEYKNCNPAPWLRKEWNDPPSPDAKATINLSISIGN